MGYYENPLIGWFLKKRIKKLVVFFILTLIFYFVFYKEYQHLESSGCTYPNCISSNCTGNSCIASGCNADNCKAGDCFGEGCEAGSCKGIGCRAGDCYGKDCIPGICIDPDCSSKDAKDNICVPFCKNGQAKKIPYSNFYKYTSKLPDNTYLNPNYCSPKKPSYILKDDKHLWNYKIDTAEFDYAGTKTREEIENPDDLEAGKRFILSNDTEFKSTYPNITKKYNCTWCSNLKDNEICASYKPYLNPISNEYTWYQDDWRCQTLKDDGKPDTCKKSNSDMKLIKVESVQYQINIINSTNLSTAEKNFKIDEILGEILTFQCANKTCSQHISLKNNLTYLDGTFQPCKRRSYLAKKTILNNKSQYLISGFNIFEQGSPEEIEYLNLFSSYKKTFRDDHVWVYYNTIGNDQYYKCHWCDKVLKIENQALPRYSNEVLKPCFYSSDFNHQMYQLSDENKNVYLKCFKCEKEVYVK